MSSPLIVLAAVLYCWFPTIYDGRPAHPACALTYEACQKLVSDHGGACRSQ